MKSNFLGWVFRMPLIRRWSTMFTHRQEDIAQHSHQVAVVAHLLCVISNRTLGTILDPGKAASIALFHEVAEVVASDLPSNLKYMNEAFTREIKKIEHATELVCLMQLPMVLRQEYEGLIDSAMIEQPYKDIVKAADIFCAVVKAKQELKHHNYDFVDAELKLSAQLNEYKTKVKALTILMDVFLDDTCVTLDAISSKGMAA